MKMSRRLVLRGIGGAVVSLPFLEGLMPREVSAGDATQPYAIFFRQANGVAQEQNNDEIGSEPERFFPTALGPLTEATMMGRAVDELVAFRNDLLIVKNVNMFNFNYGDGHARGVMQGLTASGPTVEEAGGDSEAGGMSIDHRIGAELNPDGRDSLVLYCGASGGWLGGACQSYRASGVRRAALHNPFQAYTTMVGGETGLTPEAQMQLVERQRSVNDLVRDQLVTLQSHPALSRADHDRLQLHLDAIRDLEVALTCQMSADEERTFEGMSTGYDSTDGDETLAAARLHMDVAALAVACGYTRSVSIQVGPGNDGSTRYRNTDTGALMENYHYVSHRRTSHDSTGAIIAGSDYLHHLVDRQFAQTFRHLLERLAAYSMPDGQSLLAHGLAIWHNDNSNGPPHGSTNVPYIIGGSANGFLRQGEYLEVEPGSREPTHNKMLNTIGTAVGLRKADGSFLDDFGDPSLPRGLLTDIMR